MPLQHYRQALPAGFRVFWYEIERVLGQGGFGITYFARDTNLEQPVAIKEYLPTDIARRGEQGDIEARGGDEEAYRHGMARFLTEARTLNRFDHPNIVRVHSVFEANNTAYMVMRYEDGEALNVLLERSRTLSQERLMAIVRPLLDGLAQIHAAGYIHRDVQPANIYLRRDGSPVLLDFGAAREAESAGRTMTILVAPGYAPIEQYYARGNHQGPWTDIYGLGASLYHAVTGVPPVDAIERSRGILGSTRDVLVPAAVAAAGRYDDALLRAIDHALMFNEKDRPTSAAAWLRELEDVSPPPTQDRTSNPPLSPFAEPIASPATTRVNDPSVSRRARPWGLVVVASVTLALGVVWMFSSPTAKQSMSVLFAPASPDSSVAQPTAANSPLNPEVRTDSDRSVALGSWAGQLTPRLDSLERATEPSRQAATGDGISILEPRTVPPRDTGPGNQLGGADEAMRPGGAIAPDPERANAGKLADVKPVPLSAREHAVPGSIPSPTRTVAHAPAPGVAVPTRHEAGRGTPPGDSGSDTERPPAAVSRARALIATGEFQAARTMLIPAATAGDAEAQDLLGNLLSDDRAGPPDPAAALEWQLKSARQGWREAAIRVARTYAHERGGIRHDDFLAYTWFVLAEQTGAFDVAGERDQISRKLQPEQLPQALALASALRASMHSP